MNRFELGEELQDIVTGYKGIAMCRTEFLTGCVHYALAMQGIKDGQIKDWEHFDQSRLRKIGEGVKLNV